MAVKFRNYYLGKSPIRKVVFPVTPGTRGWRMESKKFTGAPFGTQSARFDVSAIYPNVKKPSTVLQAPYSKTLCSDLSRKLGPGTYSIDNGCFGAAAQTRLSSSSWAKAQEAMRLTNMPHFRYKEICTKEKKARLGPGRYEYADFLQLAERRPHSIRGICNSGEVRFKDRIRGSGLGPGTYNLKNGMDEMLKRVVSVRGPYEIFTGDRSKPIICGHFATTKKPTELSGSKVKSFLEELETRNKKKHGVFSTLARFGCPTDRIFFAAISQYPQEQVGDIAGILWIFEYENQPPFWTGAKRFDRKAYRLFFGNANPVGVGRYDNTKYEKYPKKIRYRSLYMNETQRYLSNLERDKERITPVNKGHWGNSPCA
uniref:Ciliary microtubule associated protein 2 n=1 Tax=Salvator merianae TaxID=96440 RepID=A0A8D0DXC6_SALMN